MRTLFASVFMENKEYERALMIGICRECPKINLLAVSCMEEAGKNGLNGILLTDADIYGSFVLKKEDIQGLPIKETVRKMTSMYFDMTGEIFAAYEEGVPALLEFYSRFGGSGVTSISIAAARVLAASSENKVIYLNLKRYDDYELYLDVDFSNLSSKRKFIYKIKKTASRFLMDEFIKEDEWGVWYFCPQHDRNSFEYECEASLIINWLLEYKDISYIVADSYGDCFESAMQIEVINGRDSRYLRYLKNPQKGTFIYNFTDYEDEGYCIPEDNRSFVIKNGRIELSMTGRFLSSLESIVECLKTKRGF